ncbi:MAG: hypothetical protein CO182_06255, partial [Lysobacterales bacterium CG_4_9_14_3_um_filter_62_6]
RCLTRSIRTSGLRLSVLPGASTADGEPTQAASNSGSVTHNKNRNIGVMEPCRAVGGGCWQRIRFGANSWQCETLTLAVW